MALVQALPQCRLLVLVQAFRHNRRLLVLVQAFRRKCRLLCACAT